MRRSERGPSGSTRCMRCRRNAQACSHDTWMSEKGRFPGIGASYCRRCGDPVKTVSRIGAMCLAALGCLVLERLLFERLFQRLLLGRRLIGRLVSDERVGERDIA